MPSNQKEKDSKCHRVCKSRQLEPSIDRASDQKAVKFTIRLNEDEVKDFEKLKERIQLNSANTFRKTIKMSHEFLNAKEKYIFLKKTAVGNIEKENG